MTEELTTFQLSDVEVDTLGLVHRGANGEEVFLTKTDDNDAVEQKVVASVWQKFLNLFKKAAEATVAESVIKETVAEESITDNTVNSTIDSAVTGDSDEIHKDEPIAPPLPEVVAEVIVEEVTKIEAPEGGTGGTAPVEEQTMAENEVATVESVAKADFDAMVVELRKAQEELEKAKVEREQAVFLAKAQTYTALPVATKELANQLYAISKWDNTRLGFWQDLLTSVDKMVVDAGMFSERGSTTGTLSDAVSKALAASDPREALKNLSPTDAAAYVKSMRERVRGR